MELFVSSLADLLQASLSFEKKTYGNTQKFCSYNC